MNAIIGMLVAVVPQAIMAIAAKLLTQSMVQAALERIVLAGLKHAAKLTVNQVDDQVVADIEQRLKA